MTSKTIIEQKEIEETVKSITADSFTVLDFMKAMQRIYTKDWEKLVERFGFYEANEDTPRRHIFQTGLTCIHTNQTPFSYRS